MPSGKNSNQLFDLEGVYNLLITANPRLKVYLESDEGALD